MLDFPAAADALWQIASATGIKPEWLLPVLSHESGFNPAVQNQAGASYFGIGQNGTADIQNYAGTDPQTYMTWPASKQLSTVVLGYFSAAVHSYGPLRSGVRVYQAEYLPGTLSTARKLTDVIASVDNDPHGFYSANAGLDVNHDGAITLGDLASIVAAEARKSVVQQAITATYAARDGGGLGGPNPTDINEIVYGDDFGFGQIYRPWLLAGGIFLGAAAASYWIWSQPRPRRRRRRR